MTMRTTKRLCETCGGPATRVVTCDGCATTHWNCDTCSRLLTAAMKGLLAVGRPPDDVMAALAQRAAGHGAAGRQLKIEWDDD
jgi:hypothetical protein